MLFRLDKKVKILYTIGVNNLQYQDVIIMQEPIKNGTTRNRVLYFDVMNVLACIAVVILHHNTAVHSFSNGRGWVLSLMMECTFYWAVPIFLMVSGSNLLGYHKMYGLKTFFQKRFVRTFIPWLIWSLVLLIWKLKTKQIVPENPSFTYYFNLVFQNKVNQQYWFFASLFSCYLLLPILTYLTEHRQVMWYSLLIIILYYSVQPMLWLFQPLRQNIFQFYSDGMILYFILGWLLNNTELNKKQRLIIYLLGIAGLVFRFVYTYTMSMEAQVTDTSIKGYRFLHAVTYSAAIFVFLKQVNWEKLLPQWLKKLLPKLASYSFGVYLLHSIVMYYEKNLLHLKNSDLAFKTICIPLTYVISIAIVALLKKIPVIKKYIC